MTTTTTTTTKQHHLTIPLVVLLSCIALFSLDKDTHSFYDLLRLGNVMALLLYFLPTYILCLTLFTLFSKKYSNPKCLALSLVIGIPISFALIIGVFLLLRL